MRSLYSHFYDLWPKGRNQALKQFLSKVSFFYFPDDLHLIQTERRPWDHVIVMNSGDRRDAISLIAQGFEHCIQKDRQDFPEELLASALMVARPAAFTRNPIPFFFTGFSNSNSPVETEQNLLLKFSKSAEKPELLAKLADFLKQTPRLKGLTDLVVQIADELIANALYNAPVNEEGVQLYKDTERTTPVELLGGKKARLFSCFSEERLIIGCEDPYGSLKRSELLAHLSLTLKKDQAAPRDSIYAGAGLGIKYMIENSAGFYIYGESHKRSLVACNLLFKGIKHNLTQKKHYHLSIR